MTGPIELTTRSLSRHPIAVESVGNPRQDLAATTPGSQPICHATLLWNTCATFSPDRTRTIRGRRSRVHLGRASHQARCTLVSLSSKDLISRLFLSLMLLFILAFNSGWTLRSDSVRITSLSKVEPRVCYVDFNLLNMQVTRLDKGEDETLTVPYGDMMYWTFGK
jgi:hypothetical protein